MTNLLNQPGGDFRDPEISPAGPRETAALPEDVAKQNAQLVQEWAPKLYDASAADIDETLTQAGWALRSGGLLCLTLPVGGTGEDVIGGAADLRAVVARAADAGFALVGDVDGDLTARLRHASRVSADPDAAHALVRLTLRRR